MAVFKGNGVIWNPEKKKPLCTFHKGELRTSDKELIAKLDAMGYERVHYPDVIEIDDFKVIEDKPKESLEDLKAHCKEKGYRGYYRITDVDRLKEFIAKREGD